jgi:hypothetical protein
MADTLKSLYRNTLGTSSSALYTAPASPVTTTILRNIILANKTTSAVTVTLDIGGTQIVPGITINPNSSKFIDLYTIVQAGTAINGVAGTASAIDCTISGMEVV